MTFRYRISGLAVDSELALPGATPDSAALGAADISIRRAAALDDIQDPEARGPNWASGRERFLLRVPRVASFLVTGGREILVQPEPGVDEADTLIFLTGSAMGALLYQRGQILLHASAVRVGDQAVLFAGRSGAGKSTLAALLSGRGYPVVNDDVCCIAFDDAGLPSVLPDGRMLKLWADTVDELGVGAHAADRVRSSIAKYYVALPSAASATPLPISAVYLLRDLRPPLEPGIERPSALDAAQLLRRQVYRPRLMTDLGMGPTYLRRSIDFQRHAGIFTLTRPRDFAATAETLARLDAHWRSLGILGDTA